MILFEIACSMRINPIYVVLFLLAISLGATAAPKDSPATTGLLQVSKIWDAAPHNAFTDLIRFQIGGCAHSVRAIAPGKTADGHIRVIESNDTEAMEFGCAFTDPAAISVMPSSPSHPMGV